jgi:hypothetical protein
MVIFNTPFGNITTAIEPRFRVCDIGFTALYLLTDYNIINRSFIFTDETEGFPGLSFRSINRSFVFVNVSVVTR